MSSNSEEIVQEVRQEFESMLKYVTIGASSKAEFSHRKGNKSVRIWLKTMPLH